MKNLWAKQAGIFEYQAESQVESLVDPGFSIATVIRSILECENFVAETRHRFSRENERYSLGNDGPRKSRRSRCETIDPRFYAARWEPGMLVFQEGERHSLPRLAASFLVRVGGRKSFLRTGEEPLCTPGIRGSRIFRMVYFSHPRPVSPTNEGRLLMYLANGRYARRLRNGSRSRLLSWNPIRNPAKLFNINETRAAHLRRANGDDIPFWNCTRAVVTVVLF